MRYSLKLTVDDPKIYDLMKTELKDWKRERSTTALRKIKKGVEIEVQAKDAVALRASLNSITQLLKVYEGVQKIK